MAVQFKIIEDAIICGMPHCRAYLGKGLYREDHLIARLARGYKRDEWAGDWKYRSVHKPKSRASGHYRLNNMGDDFDLTRDQSISCWRCGFANANLCEA